MPKLSFIIGAFNRPYRMRTCLASIADQSFTDWEAVIVDNSDDPKAIELQREFAKMDPRIRYEHVGERAFDPRVGIRSLYDASEIGVTMTTGSWLCFPNDDSYYCPWFAERMLNAAERENWEFVFSNIIIGRPDIEHYTLDCQPWACAVDKTCYMFKREWFPAEWPGKVDQYGVADGVLVNTLVARGIRVGKVPQVLVVHN
jgi:glycosyltransferase involved in cell wall biosynthesis